MLRFIIIIILCIYYVYKTTHEIVFFLYSKLIGWPFFFCNTHDLYFGCCFNDLTMPPKKGLTQEEKLSALLNWFQSDHMFYTLKEIESKASKQCKIPPMQMKELVLALVEEGLVEQDRCGTTNLYWSFPYLQHKKQQETHDRLNRSIANLEMERDSLLCRCKDETGVRNQTHERASKIRFCDQSLERIDSIQSQLQSLKDSESVENLVTSLALFSDSIDDIICYLSRQTGLTMTTLKTEFELPLEFEEIRPGTTK